jgi:hypothetical protein
MRDPAWIPALALLALLAAAPTQAHGQWRGESAFAAPAHASVAAQADGAGDEYHGVIAVAAIAGVLLAGGAAAKSPTTAGAVGGLGGFLLGFVPGAALAIAAGGQPIIECADCDAGLQGGLIGGYIGMALLTPYFVHRKSGGEGSLGAAYQRSAAIAGVGLATMFWGIAMEDRSFGGTSAPSAASFLLTPVAQVLSAVHTERRTAAQARRGGAAGAVTP